MPRTKKEVSATSRPRRVTLRDIAEVAGVHVMTVSDALNGTRSVAPKTRENVRRIAAEMNYVPNSAARALVRGRSDIITVVSGILSEPYYANLVHHLEDHISAAGLHMLLMRTQTEVKSIVGAAGSITFDGAIVIDRMEVVEELESRSNAPCVSIGTSAPARADSILIDLSAGVARALELMLTAGRGRIAYLVTAPIMEQNSEVRARVYLATMQAAKRAPEIINVNADELHRIEAGFKQYIQRNGAPDALFCQNDEVAMIAFRVLRNLGYYVPDDVLLVGCDGQRHMEYFEPPLSTVAQPLKAMADKAWEFLHQRIAQPDLPRQQAVFEGQLLVRESLMPTQISTAKSVRPRSVEMPQAMSTKVTHLTNAARDAKF